MDHVEKNKNTMSAFRADPDLDDDLDMVYIDI